MSSDKRNDDVLLLETFDGGHTPECNGGHTTEWACVDASGNYVTVHELFDHCKVTRGLLT